MATLFSAKKLARSALNKKIHVKNVPAYSGNCCCHPIKEGAYLVKKSTTFGESNKFENAKK
jgi:hypothetical protein